MLVLWLVDGEWFTSFSPTRCAHGAPRTCIAGKTVDHATYMSAAAGTADILFATDFDALACMVADVAAAARSSLPHASGAQARSPSASDLNGKHHSAGITKPRVLRSADFLQLFADVSRTRTLTGYNPLLEDYTNTRILLS